MHGRAARLAATLRERPGRTGGRVLRHVRVGLPGGAAAAVDRAREAGFNLLLADADTVGIACDETTTDAELLEVAALLAAGQDGATVPGRLAESGPVLPAGLARSSGYLTHPVFNEHHSETAMLRYLRRLADFDIALDRSMIPLGSCTMKLNATAEMEPVSWPEFAGLHPFAPPAQAAGYAELISDLERWLAEITGYDAVSLQPNAGSQGELAGLLAIRGYHSSRGDAGRDICLIPESAHGTNAASAVLAGLRVVVVNAATTARVDLADLHAKLDERGGQIAALMLTYPSTHGVFEETVTQVCEAVHEAGGQVYVDGANLNALVGLARPGWFGADVCHLNLHKTFCIPHGGGGPGVGPVAARAHLAPFLPTHRRIPEAGPQPPASARSAAAPWGGGDPADLLGLHPDDGTGRPAPGHRGRHPRRQLRGRPARPALPRLTPGAAACGARVHPRPAPPHRETGVNVEDVAKRLIDYGFHAPTMSFPVAGTLMVEPTESEDLAELDRFCDAMIAIRREIGRVASGAYDSQDNPLRNAPHTASMLLEADWKHPYERAEAAYPLPGDRRAKYWPPVRRIDQAYGDRNLVCACPPAEAFAE